MKFWLRWLANGVAIFLALYLADSLLHGRFRIEATWAGVVAAILLGFINGFFRPLHRARTKPHRAALSTAVNVLLDALLLQIFVWVGADVTSQGFVWVLLTAAFTTLVSGLINWQVGFNQKERPRSTVRERMSSSTGRTNGHKPARS